MELVISASGKVEGVQLTVAPSKQSRIGLRQGLPAGISNCVTPESHKEVGKACLKVLPHPVVGMRRYLPLIGAIVFLGVPRDTRPSLPMMRATLHSPMAWSCAFSSSLTRLLSYMSSARIDHGIDELVGLTISATDWSGAYLVVVA